LGRSATAKKTNLYHHHCLSLAVTEKFKLTHQSQHQQQQLYKCQILNQFHPSVTLISSLPTGKGKDKVHPRIGHEGPEKE
jgi:hypothetical protein